MSYSDVLSFWFEEVDESLWWKKDEGFDQKIRERFLTLHEQANRCELFTWRTSAQGRLAEIILLDQFSRNMFRGSSKAFASDVLALTLAQEMISLGQDKELSEAQRRFVYMPHMHSESLIIHEEAVKLFEQLGNEKVLGFEIRHKDIIEQYGRYPHRNDILGRESTAEEIEFLKQPGSSF
ncbi:DUF924 family protein [Reinekea sp.]|jgi:uncharacterized protein (DUF924 family)|uniref:DUF924 family protein n=1 Tax=Reinekea sp. TaxID=1970455 RepID=UPI00398A4E41